MSCCGGSRPQKVRRQAIEPVTKDVVDVIPQTVVQKKISRQAAQPVSIQRQYVVPRQQCAKCGYPTMTVTIAGRERQQCSNANCRIVVQ